MLEALLKLTKMNFKSFAKRFLAGVAVGLFIAAIAWSYSVFFHANIAPQQGLVGLLVLLAACGAIATIADLETLMDNLPPL